MTFLFVFGLPAVLFTAVGHAAAPARAASTGGAFRTLGADLVRGLRVCAMTSPQYVTAGASSAR
ncbi:hypothetical protein ACH9DO_03465 [Kocuria sp. M1N1S27]|uniref:hypothetical protein n=1 Tax=Kocuria kalidii TaxID=3376283 RepID=UPI0037A86290